MKFEVGSSGLGSENFVKLKDKEKVVGIFRGDPFTFRQHWIGNRPQTCSGNDCAVCKKGESKAVFRFNLNFITRDENNQHVAKIFQGGWKLYQTLKALHESDYDLEKTIVTITRNGSDTNTTYTILPAKEHAVSVDLEKKLTGIALLDVNPETHAGKSEEEEDDGVPF